MAMKNIHTLLKSVTRQENKYLENTLLDRPCPARRHMCFLWWHSYVKIQWLFAKQKFQICSPTMSQKLQHNNSNVDRGAAAAAAVVGPSHNTR